MADIGMDSNYNENDVYFASKDAKDTAGICLNKARSFFDMMSANYYLEKLNQQWRAYHGAYSSYMSTGHQIDFTGEQGELVNLPVNHYRNIAQHIYVMITSNRPVMEARAINTDYKSLAQTYLANGILDYYMREKHLEDCLKRATEMAVVMGAGFIKMAWNATAGEAYDFDEETGAFNYEGEIEFTNLSPFDVVVDGTKETWNHDWIITRSFQNRFNLMAKYPELAIKIKGLPSKSASSVYRMAVFSNDDTDDIPVFEFYHKRTEAMPDGRYLLFADTDIILLDTKLPYRVIPIFRVACGEIMGTPYAYTPMFDIFPIQEAINSLYGTIMTNQAAFGVQNVYVPRGADFNLYNVEGAMNIIEANAKPEALNLTQTPEEIFKFLEMLIQAAETISGVNSVTRGNPEASLKSGTSLALVQSMALQFISGLQQSYVKLIEDVGTALIQILKDFATTPKVVALVGKNNRPLLKEFTGEAISSINRVVVDVGNPLSRTIAGRVQMAEQLLQMHVLTTPEQYFMVLNTGRLDSMYEGEMAELLLIKSENERLMEGQEVHATALDQHRLHIVEHKSVLADPDLRQDADLVQKTLAHIQDHINLLRTTDPDLLNLIGEKPLQPPASMEPDQPGQGNPQSMMPQPPMGMPPGMPPNPVMPPLQNGAAMPMSAKGSIPEHAPMKQHGPNPGILANNTGLQSPGTQVTNSLNEHSKLPNVAKPPKPFGHLPTDPRQM